VRSRSSFTICAVILAMTVILYADGRSSAAIRVVHSAS